MTTTFLGPIVKAQAPRPLHAKVPKGLAVCRWFLQNRCQAKIDAEEYGDELDCPHASKHRHDKSCITKLDSGSECQDTCSDEETSTIPDCVPPNSITIIDND